jgi:segregation and condensation protein B
MARLEAALFVANGALAARKLTQLATLADSNEALVLIDQLNTAYDADGSPFRIERVGAGFQLLTRSELAPWLDRIHHRQAHLKLSPPMMETLAIIAHRQPCTRADVEAIRGIQSAELIKQLLERRLIRVVGEDKSLGRPFLYGTTKQFLESYGLTSLSELPFAERLAKPKSSGNDAAEQDLGQETTAA